ncbi:MAG: FtsX-like permease family protein [Bacteroidaceae bacterium]|nr:FtsX-like permease family protein [Bacteroidaceae bacterium]
MNKLLIYLRQALHMMKEEKLFSGIYIAGTAVAVAFTMVIVMAYNFKIAPVYPEVNRANTYYWHGLRTFNKYEENAELCYGGVGYKMVERLKKMKSVEKVGVTNFTSGDWLCRMQQLGGERKKGFKKYVDDGFFQVYEFEFLEGRPFTHKEWVNSRKLAVITDKLAQRIFGTKKHLVGKELRVASDTLTICGVVKASSIVSSKSYADLYTCCYSKDDLFDYWGFNSIQEVIIVSRDGKQLRADINEMLNRLNAELKASGENWKFLPPEEALSPHWMLGLSNNTFNVSYQSGDWVYILLLILMLLLVPTVNLSGIISGRMESRLAEMGVRKAFGAKKRELLFQIMAENIVLTFIGSVVGLLMAWGIVSWGGIWMLDALGFSYNTAYFVDMNDFVATGEMLFAPVVFGIALFVCLFINTLAAILPAWLSLRKPIVESMMEKR